MIVIVCFSDFFFLVRNLLVCSLSNNMDKNFLNPIYPNPKTNIYEG